MKDEWGKSVGWVEHSESHRNRSAFGNTSLSGKHSETGDGHNR
jgi:hypothetical protein